MNNQETQGTTSDVDPAPVERLVMPSVSGKKRYEPDGFYTANCVGNERGTPCTCDEECPFDCKGQCGCEACHEAYGDFLSLE
jgi:hypothetical protein